MAANEQTKPEWGEAGQPAEGGTLPDRQPSRGRGNRRPSGKGGTGTDTPRTPGQSPE
jgi:hypothetical protein